MHELAVLYMAQARQGEAEPLLLQAFQGRQTKLRPEHPRRIESLNELVRLHEAWDKPEETQKWRAKPTSAKNATK
jgi:hypothetical protein